MSKNICFCILIFSLLGCASHHAGDSNVVYGFFYGLWHGICFPFVLIGKLFYFLGFFESNFFENIKFIGQPNTGISYFLGFIIGILILSGFKRTYDDSKIS